MSSRRDYYHSLLDEYLPGSERERTGRPSQNFPTLVADVVELRRVVHAPGRVDFPFRSWAAANSFHYPHVAEEFLGHTESAAEAFFAREFAKRPGAGFHDNVATLGPVSLTLQEKRGLYRLDAVVRRGRLALLVEIDGMSFHARTYDQVARDYLRERRVVACGYTVIRFTAQEVFHDAPECWRQIDAILAAWEARS